MVSYTFKIATEAWEMEQVKSLNYETFVEEIPQHASNATKELTDVFHDQNTYILCVHEKQVLAMLAVRGQRPFSLDRKLKDLDSYLPPGRTLCEVRLLAARKGIRHSRIVRGLLAETVAYCIHQGYDTALISGYLEQIKLYKHLGFVPFGPVVGTPPALFQPMYLTTQAHAASKTSFLGDPVKHVNLLPGPVPFSPSVRRALTAPEVSHRSSEYLQLHSQTQARLIELTGASYVQLFTGSGTLANDVIAAKLSLLPGKGLILSNGEFGSRLLEQARSFGLVFETFAAKWGQPFDEHLLCEKLRQTSGMTWLWAVLSESSTGMLNDLEMLKKIARQYGLRLCLDCISAIGNTPVDLRDVYLASACSSKGLRSMAGLGIVFYNHPPLPPHKPVPVYLDLYRYEQAGGVPFTMASNLTAALEAALADGGFTQRFADIRALDSWLRVRLSRLGLMPLVSGPHACPGIITIPLPPSCSSRDVGDRLRQSGFLLSFESHYLLERNWIQICLMSDLAKSELKALLETLQKVI